MDTKKIDVNALAKQLRKPEGTPGVEVGGVMATFNAPANSFAFKCLDVQPTDHVLEIGFGPGEWIAEAVRLAPKSHIAGIDHSQTMLDAATTRNREAIKSKQVELVLGTADKLPYDDERFDKLIAINVFHFWKEPSTELAECKRVLKPGGCAVFYVTHPTSWLPGIEKTGIFVAREPEETEALMAKAGFRNIESRWIDKNVWIHTDEGKGYVVMGGK